MSPTAGETHRSFVWARQRLGGGSVASRLGAGRGRSGWDVENGVTVSTGGERARPGRPYEGTDMKYMIMLFGGLGATMETRSPEWITSMHEFMMKLDGELREAGELVAGVGLVDPSQAKTVRFQNGVPVPTDGPFAEVKESLAGYWIVEVDEDRAIEIASRVVSFTEHPMEVRPIMNESPPPL
jgi:hypothetical protein